MNKWSLVVAVVGVLLSLILAAVSAAYFVGGLENKVKVLESQSTKEAVNTAIKQIEDKRDEAISMLEASLPGRAVMAVYAPPGNLPKGWVYCGEKETPEIHNRFLLGTTTLSDIPKHGGDLEHSHSMTATITGESRGEHRPGKKGTPDDFADNIHDGVEGTGPRNWYHEHQVDANTHKDNTLPPFIKVLFLCRVPGP